MTAISPGDEVTVTITGTVLPGVLSHHFSLETGIGGEHRVYTGDPDVRVTVLRPDRPTRREVLEQHKETWIGRPGEERYECYCGDVGNHSEHLDAVLTKWEES